MFDDRSCKTKFPLLYFSEGDTGIVAAETQRFGNGDGQVGFHRFFRRVVQVAFRIGVVQSDGGRDDAVA